MARNETFNIYGWKFGNQWEGRHLIRTGNKSDSEEIEDMRSTFIECLTLIGALAVAAGVAIATQ